jgi:uncharacterized protein (DUF488 family)
VNERELDAAGKRVPVLTVGHGDRTPDELLGALAPIGRATLIDVRSYPASRRFPAFNRDALARTLADAGHGYRWLGRELGGKRRLSAEADARHPALAGAGLRAFAVWMECARFRAAIAELAREAADRTPVLLCAERDPARCHRWLIADRLVAIEGVEVAHLLEPDRTPRPHEVSATARPANGILRYDRGRTGPLELGDSDA